MYNKWNTRGIGGEPLYVHFYIYNKGLDIIFYLTYSAAMFRAQWAPVIKYNKYNKFFSRRHSRDGVTAKLTIGSFFFFLHLIWQPIILRISVRSTVRLCSVPKSIRLEWSAAAQPYTQRVRKSIIIIYQLKYIPIVFPVVVLFPYTGVHVPLQGVHCRNTENILRDVQFLPYYRCIIRARPRIRFRKCVSFNRDA